MFHRKADGAVALVAQRADPLVGAAAPGFGHSHFPTRRHPLRDGPRRLVSNLARALNIGGHIGAVMLHGLETAHRPPELGALFHIVHGHIQHGRGAAHHLDAMRRRRPGQRPLHDGPTFADCAQHGFGWHGHAVQPHFAEALVADGADLLHGHAGRVGGYKEQGNAILRVVAGGGGAGGDDDDVGGVGVGDEQLDAVDDIAVPRGVGSGGHAPGLGSGRRFGERQSQARAAGADAGQDVVLLGGTAGVQHGEAAQHDGGKVGAGQQGAPHFLNQHRQVQERPAGAAVLLRERDARPAQAGHLPPEVVGEPPVVILHFPHQRKRGFLRQELPRRVFQHLLDFAQPHVHSKTPLREPGISSKPPGL